LEKYAAGKGANINVEAEVAFINEKTPEYFNKEPVYVIIVAETSDGHNILFARIRQALWSD
jgi:ATP-dependent DNA helicase HFM1/MER3